MELNFVQSSEVFGKNTLAWETEFEATGDFNLHVERNKGGDILVYQRTAGSGYAIVEEFRGMDNKPAIDLDFTSVVYPKFVKIVSESQPTYATVTTNGEITEIKSQSKEVEITANGTMDITPDAGFSYLNSVKVKTNVPQSGEGGGSASTMEYFLAQDAPQFTPYMSVVKAIVHSGDVIQISPYFPKFVDIVKQGEILAFGVDFQARNLVALGEQKIEKSMLDAIIQETGLSADQIAAIPRITESEFYTL